MKAKLFIFAVAIVVLLTVSACEDVGENLFVGTWVGPAIASLSDSYVFSDGKAFLSSEYKVTYNNVSGLAPAEGTYTFNGNKAEITFKTGITSILPPFTGKQTVTIVNNSFEITSSLGVKTTYTKSNKK